MCGYGVCIIQVASSGRQLRSAPSSAWDANPQIGPSTVSNPSFTSGDSRTFSERRRGILIYRAPDDASAVDYTKEDMEDDEDGVVDSPMIQHLPGTESRPPLIGVGFANLIADPSVTTVWHELPEDQMPRTTLGPRAVQADSFVRSPVVDASADLARVQLNGTLPLVATGVTMSSGADARLVSSRSLAGSHRLLRRCAAKRYRNDAFLEGVEARSSKYCRSEDVLSTHKDHGGDSTARPRSAM
jgi:hypothetical protein